MPLTPHDLVPAEDPRAPGAVARRVRERIAVTQRELRASQTSLREQFRQLEEQAGELEVLAEEILTRNAELERFTVWLERLRESAAAVASRRGTRGVLAAACRHARELLEARVVVAALADADDLRWYGARGSVSPRERRLPRFDAACRRVLETGLSVVVEGAAAGVHTVAVAPIRAGTGVVGVLVCGWETELPPSLAQVRLAETLGAQVGVALGRERTRGRDRRTRRARERFLSALGGELARPAEELSSLAGRLERADAAERARIVLRMEALAREIAEVASDLRSPGEERSPDTAIPLREVLEDALLAVGPRARRACVRLALRLEEPSTRVSLRRPETAGALFERLLSEGIRTPGATEVTVRASADEGEAAVVVSPADPSPVRLALLRRRARRVGASLSRGEGGLVLRLARA